MPKYASKITSLYKWTQKMLGSLCKGGIKGYDFIELIIICFLGRFPGVSVATTEGVSFMHVADYSTEIYLLASNY